MLPSGDAYILRSVGGGCFGSPLDRDLDALETDLRQGYVLRAAAERGYRAAAGERLSEQERLVVALSARCCS